MERESGSVKTKGSSPDHAYQVTKLCDILGEYGLHQILFTLWNCYLLMVFSMSVLSVAFLAPDIGFSCIVETNSSYNHLEVSEDQCSYKVYSDDAHENDTLQLCSKWNYSDKWGSTLTEKFNLVCGNHWLKSFSNSILQVGNLLASFCSSYFADRYGRRPVVLACIIPGVVAYIMFLASPNIVVFTIGKLLCGFSGISVNYISFIILMEITSEKYRGFAGIVSTNLGWTFGYMLLPGIFWLLEDQFHFQIFMATFYAFILLSYWTVPESVRWLLLNNKIEEASDVVKMIFRINNRKGIHFDSQLVNLQLKKLKLEVQQPKTSRLAKSTTMDLFNGSEMRKRTLVILFLWFTVGLVYFGISMNSELLGEDLSWNFFYLAAIELPAIAASLFAEKWFGRKPLVLSSFMGTGLLYFITLAIPSSFANVRISMLVLSKLFVSACYFFLFPYTSELFPTCLRSTGVMAASGASRFGSIIAPFVAEITKMTSPFVVFTIFGTICVISSALVYFLPETKFHELPETLEEVNLKIKPIEDTKYTNPVPNHPNFEMLLPD